jgi:hypothetical protein
MLIPAQNSNKVNCKIQDYFANRQIKEDVKCNNYHLSKTILVLLFVVNIIIILLKFYLIPSDNIAI